MEYVDFKNRKHLSPSRRLAMERKLDSEEVEIKDPSDVITVCQTMKNGKKCFHLKNLMTGKKACTEDEKACPVAREGIRYVETSRGEENDGLSGFWGLYGCMSKQYDVLMILECELKKDGDTYSWVERKGARAYISKEYNWGRRISLFRSAEMTLPTDVCGQAYLHGCRDSLCGLKKTLFEYFGNVIIQTGGAQSFNAKQKLSKIFCSIKPIIALSSTLSEPDNGNADYLTTRVLKFGDFPDLGEPDKDILKKMEWFAREIFAPDLSCSLNYNKNSELHYDDILKTVSYIQKTGDCYVERFFMPITYLGPGGGVDEVEFYEVQQVKVEKKYYGEALTNVAALTVDAEEFMEDKRYKWAADYTMKPLLNSIKHSYVSHKKYTHVVNDFMTKTGISPYNLAAFIESMSREAAIEKIFKSSSMNNNAAYDLLRISGLYGSPKMMFTGMFGTIDEKARSVDKILYLPKGMMEYYMESQKDDNPYGKKFRLLHISYARDIFSGSPEAKQYFQRMNKEDALMLLETLYTGTKDCYEVLKELVFLGGYRNWKKYAAYACKPGINLDQYKDYLRILIVLKENWDNAGEFSWKIPVGSIEESLNSAKKFLTMIQDKELLDEAQGAFNEQQGIWKTFEYEDGEYAVIAPTAPFDLIEEGTALHHCAKDFIMPVARGNTIVLFIRKKTDMDKPYYTLEVKDGTIRQCHGFGNSNVNEENSLPEFLEKYREAKELDIGEISERLGPD